MGGGELISFNRCSNEIRELVRTAHHVFLVEDTLGKAAEKARAAILGNLSARAEECGLRIKVSSEGKQILLITAGAM